MAGESIDRVVLELEARDGQFRSEIQGAATVTDKALSRIEASATRMERQVGRSFGAAAQQSRLLGYQISDIGVQLSAGTSPFLVLAQQGPQVANALEGARGAVGRFATFLSGPYGAAILAATTLLGVWLSKTEEAANTVDDLVQKMKDQERQSELTRQAQAIFGNTIEGVTQALYENQKAIDQLNQSQDTSAEKALKVAQAQQAKAIRIREATVALLEQAKAELAAANVSAQANAGQGVGGAAGAFAGGQASIAQANLDAINKQLSAAEAALKTAESQVTQSRALLVVEQETASAAEKVNRKYDQRIDAARRLAIANGTIETSLAKQVAAIEKARDAEIKRLQDTERERKKTTSSLPAVTGREVAAALGTTINSGTRSAADNARVKGARNSYHLSGQAIDIPLTVNGKPLTKEGIRAALAPLGIVIKELLGPGDKGHSDHFHIAFDKKRRGGDEVAAAAQRDADTEERRRQSYENELANAMADELAARRALISSAEEIDKINLDAIEVERKRYNDNLDSLVSQLKLRGDEADELRRINDETAKYRAELVQRNAEIRKFRADEAQRQRDAQLAGVARATEAEILRGNADLALTLDERNAIARRLVDLQYQEEKAQNDFVIAAAERLRTEVAAGRASQEALDAALDAARIAKLRNDSIATRKANDTAAIDRNNPLDRYIADIADTKTRTEEAIVRELQSVNDGITDALTKQLGIKNKFIRDLFSIFLDQNIFQPLAEALRKGQSGGGGIFGTIVGAVGAVFGGGGLSTGNSGGGIKFGGKTPGRASGGPVEAGRLYRINESGIEGFVPATSGTIIPAGQMNAIASRAGGQGTGTVRVIIEEGPNFMSTIRTEATGVSLEVTRASAPTLIDAAANETLRRASRPKV